MGKRVYSEIADPDRDYAKVSRKKEKAAQADGSEETIAEYFMKKHRGGTKKPAKGKKKKK